MLALGAALLLGACGEDTVTPEQEPDAPSAGAPSAGAPSAEAPAPGASSPQARQAVADLTQRLGVPEDEVRVVSVEEVTWNDGSLGCAEAGTSYTQALVEGSRITLEADGRTHAYHAGGGRAPFYCADPTQ